MLLIKRARSTDCRVDRVGEEVESLTCQPLGATQQFLGSPLRLVTPDMSRVVFEMNDEPQFDARIADGEVDLVVLGKADRIGKSRVFVGIEDTPELVSRSTLSPLGLAGIDLLACDGCLYQLKGSTVKVVDGEQYAFTIAPSDVNQIPLFCLSALDEGQDLAPYGVIGGAALG